MFHKILYPALFICIYSTISFAQINHLEVEGNGLVKGQLTLSTDVLVNQILVQNLSGDVSNILFQTPNTGFSSTSGVLLGYSGTNGVLMNYENAHLRFGTFGVEHMTINNLGNVGIGELFPQSKLTVGGDFAVYDENNIASFYSIGSNSFISLINNNPITPGADIGYFDDFTDNYFYINTPSGSFGEIVLWDTGTLGLGMGNTVLPDNVNLVLKGRNFHFGNDDAVIMSDPTQPSGDLWLVSNDAIVARLDENNDENGHFVVQNSDEEPVMRVDENGTVEMNGVLNILGSENRPAGGNDDDAVVTSDLSKGTSDLFLVANDNVIVEIHSDGPCTPCDDAESYFRVVINGNVVVMELDQSGNMYIDGSLMEGSDLNRKENIVDVDNAAVLDAFRKIPVYKWNYKGEDRTHIGPMAQDLHRQFPFSEDDTAISNIDSRGILIAAVQAQQDIIESQQSQLTTQEEELATIKEEVSKLRSVLTSYLKDHK